jgi:hypothetical protein
MSMSSLSTSVGLLLILLGVVGFFATGTESPTALIPAAFGGMMAILGSLGRRENLRKHTMHGATAVALVGILGSVGGLLKLPALLGGGEVDRPAAVISQSIMALLCIAFLVLAIRSFIEARRNPKM